MQIRVNETPEVQNEGKYSVIMLDYDCDGDTKKQRLVSFGDNEKAYKALVRAKAGEAFEIKGKKNGKYFNWTDATPVEGDAVKSDGAAVASGNTRQSGWRPDPERETREERSAKQVYIIRQSSLANAVEFHKAQGNGSLDDIVATAKFMEDYVLGSIEAKMPEID